MYYSAVCYRQEGVDVRSCILSLVVNLFTHTLLLQTKACFVATFVFEVEFHVTRARSLPKINARFHILMLVSCLCDQTTNFRFWGYVTRASSLPKIKARFHIFMLVSWLCDQNDQLWFLGSKFTRCNSTHIAISAMTWFEKVGGCSTQSTPDCGSPDSE